MDEEIKPLTMPEISEKSIVQSLCEAFEVTYRNKKTVLILTILTLPLFVLQLLFTDVMTLHPSREMSPSYIYCNSFLTYQFLLNFVLGLKIRLDKCSNSFITLKGVALTWFSALLFTLASNLIICFLVFIVSPNVSAKAALVATTISWLVAFLYLYFVGIWMLGLLVLMSVEDYCGMKAIRKAIELIRGRKLHGLTLMLPSPIVTLAIMAFISFMIGVSKQNLVVWHALIVIVASLVCPLILFTFEVSRIFYNECKISHYEEPEAANGDTLCSKLLKETKSTCLAG